MSKFKVRLTRIEHLWEATIGIVWEFHHSTRIERCKKSLGVLALHSIGKNMPRVPKCQFYPSLKMPPNHPHHIMEYHHQSFLCLFIEQKENENTYIEERENRWNRYMYRYKYMSKY